CGCGISSCTKDSGITPVTRPPACNVASASTPINPTLPPPNTTSYPRATAVVANCSTACTNTGLFPCRDPVNTVTRRLRAVSVMTLLSVTFLQPVQRGPNIGGVAPVHVNQLPQ